MNKNILLLVSDSVRYDRIERHIADSESLTPNINKLIDEGEIFTQCFATADKTSPSMTTIETGQYPLRHGLLHHGAAINTEERSQLQSINNIAEWLTETHQTVGIDILHHPWLTKGYDEFRPTPHNRTIQGRIKTHIKHMPTPLSLPAKFVYSKIKQIQPNQEAESVSKYDAEYPRVQRSHWQTNQFFDFLRNANSSPWFGMIHFWDTHRRYLSDDETLTEVSDRQYEHGDVLIDELPDRLSSDNPVIDHLVNQFTDIETLGDVLQRYDASVRYVDQQIGRIINRLKSRGEYEDTLILFTADHGELLADFDREVLFTHRDCFDPTWRVPLVIKGKKFDGEEDQFVQHTDILPTVLDALGLDYATSQFDGLSLMPDEHNSRKLNREAVYMEQTHDARRSAIRTDQYKYIKNWQQNRPGKASHLHYPSETLFDLEQDPIETKNRIRHDHMPGEKLSRKYDQFYSSIPKPRISPDQEAPQMINNEVVDRLEAMGYKFD